MQIDPVIQEWQLLNREMAGTLGAARLQAHWALQTVAAAGRALVEPQPDDSHTSATWIDHVRILAGGEMKGGLHVGLQLPDLAVALLDVTGGMLDCFPLEGKTLAQAFAWLGEAIPKITGSALESKLAVPDYDLPPHPVGKGEPFHRVSPEQLEELGRWYANASLVWRAVREEYGEASPVRCWPHHFDIATLITFDRDEPDAEKARSIGCGMSSGDSGCEEPYFYINPWPPPDLSSVPPLAGGGRWHTEGWKGAMLRASDLESGADAAGQATQILTFAESALSMEKSLLRIA